MWLYPLLLKLQIFFFSLRGESGLWLILKQQEPRFVFKLKWLCWISMTLTDFCARKLVCGNYVPSSYFVSSSWIVSFRVEEHESVAKCLKLRSSGSLMNSPSLRGSSPPNKKGPVVSPRGSFGEIGIRICIFYYLLLFSLSCVPPYDQFIWELKTKKEMAKGYKRNPSSCCCVAVIIIIII